MFEVQVKKGIKIISIHMTDTPMNVINKNFIAEYTKVVDETTADESLKGAIITSSKNEFLAGADLQMIAEVQSVNECLELIEKFQAPFRKMETWGKPFVAAINGAALGGGYEITLACHYRIALNNPKAKIGLPEATLGLLPGAGGTQRLPRMLGFEKATPLIAQGRVVNPQKALELGLVDEVVDTAEEMLQKAEQFILDNPEIQQPWDQKKFKLPGGLVQSPKGAQFFPVATAMTLESTRGNYPAPLSILKCVYEGLQVPIDQGLKIEQDYFAQLATGVVAKGMIRSLFYGKNSCDKGFQRPKDVEKRKVAKLGVLGAGMMGAGIAYVAAKAGVRVVLKDISIEAAEKGKSYSQNLLDKQIAKGRLTAEKKAEILSLIETTDDPNKVEGCDLVVEAVIEDRKIKAQVTKESEEVLSEQAVFSSNTSTLPITGLALESRRPENFIGLHFFSPVDKMPLVEIILGEKTGDQALALCLDFVKQIRKTPIVVNDGRGFYTSRIFTTYIAEGIHLLNEGVAPALIENAGKLSGMPVGPLAVADEVSIDLIYHILKQTEEDLGAGSLDQVVYDLSKKFVLDLKRTGRKVGKGFYEYPQDGKKYLWPELKNLFKPMANQPALDEVKKRILTIQALEALRCFDENIVRTTTEADVGSIFGWGFPAYTGGALGYIEYCGVKEFLQDCARFSSQYGKRFAPTESLKKMAKEGKTNFYN